MNRTRQLLVWALYAFCCTIISARGQPFPGVLKPKEYIDQDVQQHKWEINVNAGSLFKLRRSGTHQQYYHLIKRNLPKHNHGRGRAWRFAISPRIGRSKQLFASDTSNLGSWQRTNYNIKPMLVIGHEWQRALGRTSLFGGVDLGAAHQMFKSTHYDVVSDLDNTVTGRLIEKSHTSLIWLSTFLGAKLYLNHRFSLSLEGHIQYQHRAAGTKLNFEDQLVSRELESSNAIVPLPSYLINLSYNLK